MTARRDRADGSRLSGWTTVSWVRRPCPPQISVSERIATRPGDIATLRMLMARRPVHRLTTIFFMVLSLLCSQLALASYVCPGQSDAEAMTAMMAAGEPCEGMDQAQPALCRQHAAGTVQSFEAIKLPAASQPMIVQVLELPPVLDACEAVALPMAATPEARPPPDPLFLSTLRLRV